MKAIIKAKEKGIPIVPVWNKSNREHQIIHSSPGDTRIEADSAVSALRWQDPYFVDADHINLHTVDAFIDHSDFFTLDVAESIGGEVENSELEDFLQIGSPYMGTLEIPGIEEPFHVTEDELAGIAKNFLGAVREAAAIHNHIVSKKGSDKFVAEVSMDEVDDPQTPVELFFILLMISHYRIPAQTIAPKFTGRFNKGVDYVGDVEQFKKEFEQDLLVIDYAVKKFGLPGNLKLSVHSGSDKFTIYPIMGELIRKYDKGIHVKTAGTNWLEALRCVAKCNPNLYRLMHRKAFEYYEEALQYYHITADISKIESIDHVEDEDLSAYLDKIESRQLLHITYGGLLTDLSIRESFFNTLNKYEDTHYELINNHISKHMELLGIKKS